MHPSTKMILRYIMKKYNDIVAHVPTPFPFYMRQLYFPITFTMALLVEYNVT